MPRGDKTGPQSQCPMTGRSQGKCGKGSRNPSQGGQRGMGSGGRGSGRGQGQGQGRGGGDGQGQSGGKGQGRGNR